jgi:hypothetical protein
MAGEVVARTTVLELVNLLSTLGWRGELQIVSALGRRTLGLDEGIIKHASSTHPEDRLGEVLFRHGVLDRAQLDEILGEVDPERRFGQLVVEKGRLTQDQLFLHLKRQVEQIFHAAILTEEGTFVFVRPEAGEGAAPHPVHLPVQALLMEGVQRIDEMALFRERIPDDGLVPEVTPRAMPKALDAASHQVLEAVDGRRSVEELARDTGLGQFATVKALFELHRLGLVQLRGRARIDDAAVRRLVGLFNEVLRELFVTVSAHGGVAHTRTTLESWIIGSGYGPVFGEQLEEDGTLDPARVALALSEVAVDSPMEGLLQALHALTSFALFVAMASLPRDQELALSRDVNARLERIRL